MEIEEARYLISALARQMDLCVMRGGAVTCTNEENVNSSRIYAEAIRVILRAAGLSDDWRTIRGGPDEVEPSIDERQPDRQNIPACHWRTHSQDNRQ